MTDKVASTCLCLFAKAPRRGETKTRLARAIGEEAATSLAQAFIVDSVAAYQQIDWLKVVIATTQRDLNAFGISGVSVVDQGQGDLGARIERVLAQALTSHDFAWAVGADSPCLPHRLLETAQQALENCDAVLGPARDGGFYLLGVKRCVPGMLDGIVWSDATTCVLTKRRLESLGFSVGMLESWFDVDEVEDLQTLKHAIDAGDVVAPTVSMRLEILDRPKR